MWWSPYCDKMIIIVASSSQNLSFTIQNPILLDVIFSSFPVASGWKTLQNQDRGICTFFFLCSVCNAIIRFGWRFIFLCIWPPGVWAGKPILRCCNIFVEQSKDTIIGSEILSKLYQGLCDLEISNFFNFIGPRFDPCPPLTHWLGQSLREEGDSFFFGDAMTSFPLVVSTEKEKLGPMLKEKEKGSLNFEDHEIKS